METNVGWVLNQNPKLGNFFIGFFGKGSMGIDLNDTQVDIHLARDQL
jgi:hypothetical protein